MRIRVWGAQGSLPSPLKPDAVKEKIIQAILEMPDLDTNDSDAVRAYVENLPPLLGGTAKGNTSCVEVQAGGETLIIDAGTGIRELGLELMKGPCGHGQGRLHILFSHPHWDHIQGFPFFIPAFIPGNQITFYSIHDLEFALTEQQRYLFFPVAIDSAQAERELAQMEARLRQRYGFVPAMQARREFIRLEVGRPFFIGPVRINTSRNHHPGDAYSYRFEDQHSVFVYGGDAEYKNLDTHTFQERINFFKDADAVIFDAQYGLRESFESKADYGHSSAMIGVDFARRAGVKKLLLTHHEPTYSDHQLQQIQETATAYQAQDPNLPTCEIIVAYEGLEIDLAPPGAVEMRLMPNKEAAVLTPGVVFDEQSVAQLAAQLDGLAQPDMPLGSIIDLSQIGRLTTASLKSLVMFSRKRKGSPVVLAAPSERVQEVIKLGGYGDYFAIYSTVEEAAKAVQARKALSLPGQTINGRYQIVEILGQSAVGTVLKVVDQTDRRSAALRVLSPAFEVETIDRFVSQMHQMLDLDHRHLAQVYDCDWSEEGNHVFIVEELLAGPTLANRLVDQADPITPDEALDLALDLTLALEYAHSRGIIHGNLKPQDIFLTGTGIKVSGFNLGRLAEGRNLLAAPALYVRASHLAPEQILGRPLDARTDLYALGVILYQMFTGRLPFEGDDQEVMRAHLEQAPVPPRQRNRTVSRSIEHLILKLLAKNPNDRYTSAQQAHQVSSSLMFSPGESGQPVRQHLVGRDIQLQTLRERWSEVEAGRGQLVFITGEPGIGKTSLAQQAAAQTEAPVVLVGHCQEQESRPVYQPLSEVLQNYFAMVPPEIFDPETHRWLSHITPLVPDLNRLIPNLPEPAELEPQQAQLRLMSSLTQFIKRATQNRPWLLILDDLQWVDEGSVELLRYLGRHLREMPLLIVGTYRDTEVGGDHPLQIALRDLGQSPTYHRLPLDRLSQANVAQVLAQLWGLGIPEVLTETIYGHTEGNPLYVKEVAEGLIDDGLVKMQAGQWHFPEVEAVRLPQSVYDAVERRIHYLNAEARDVLSQAAVLGQTFRFDDVVVMSGLSEWMVLDHLDLAMERQLVQELGGGETLRFKHVEIHHVIYNDLGALRRRRLHRRAGETIERRAEDEAERFAEELVYHFREAGDLEWALCYSIPAAQQARAAYANETALHWYELTLEMLDQLGSETAPFQTMRLSVHRSMGEVMTLIGQYDEALAHYASAVALLEGKMLTADETRQLADLCRLSARTRELQGEFDQGLEWIKKGLNHLVYDEPSLELARIYHVAALLYERKDRFDEAFDFDQRSIVVTSQLDTADGAPVTVGAYSHLGIIHHRLGDYQQAKEYFQEGLKTYQRFNDLTGQVRVYVNLGRTYGEEGDWVRANDVYDRALILARETGDIWNEGTITNNVGFIELQRGHWTRAMKSFEESLSIWWQLGARWDEANTLNNIAYVHIQRGNWADARQALERSQAIFGELGSDEMMPEVERHWAELLLKTDELDQALAHINRSIELAVTLSAPWEEGLSRRVLGQIHQARGEVDLAEAQLRRSLQILSDLDSKYHLAKTELALASLLMTSGNLEQDHNLLHQAIETFEKLGAEADLVEARRLAQGYEGVDGLSRRNKD